MDTSVENVRRRHEDSLMDLPYVVSVAIGEEEGEPVIVVGLTHTVETSEIPEMLDGYRVVVDVIGTPTAQSAGEGESDG